MAQQVLSCAVLPKLAYGLQIRSTPKALLKNLRGAINWAMGYANRINSWEVLCIVANPTQARPPGLPDLYPLDSGHVQPERERVERRGNNLQTARRQKDQDGTLPSDL